MVLCVGVKKVRGITQKGTGGIKKQVEIFCFYVIIPDFRS